ncbi:putative Ig domain-containing protein [Streptomyces sp. NPDC005648]|uniref:putative Ig domain-containing protein n=1 Tax=Streptomyces sp. NPDC005648 TaxID=3157044 RepID=UPI0033A34859
MARSARTVVLLVLVLVTAALSPHGAAAETGAGEPGSARVCPAPEPGRFSCLALVRTRPAGKGEAARAAADDTPFGYGPADLQDAYRLPSATAGTGRTVAVVDAYDNPNAADDLSAYRAQYGLPPCTESTGCFTKVDQRGGDDLPVPDDDWAMEIALDLDMVSAGCPNCRILLVEADSNSVEDLGAAVNTAVAKGAGYVSNSYGADEDAGELAYDTAYFDHPGVVVTAAAGDGDYGTEYPAASPYVTAVGGTTLLKDSSARGWSETVWGDFLNWFGGTGSGCSAQEPKPSWQTDPDCPRRMLNDVSAVADPDNGVAIYDSFQDGSFGNWFVVGGTSAASPLVAAAYALAGPPRPGSLPASYPYAHPGALNDVTSGENGFCDTETESVYFCTAGEGYDGPTGLGSPAGVSAFSGASGGDGATVTVTAPTDQNTRTGTAVSLQAQGHDSVPGRTLTYTASGLPPGVSLDPATGAISGTPTTWGTWGVTVTAQDSSGAYGAASFTWRITTAGGCYPGQVLGNTGFELPDFAPWTRQSPWFLSDDTSDPPVHSGHYIALYDHLAVSANTTRTLRQTVTLPTGCTSYSLGYWLRPITELASTDPARDTLQVRVLDQAGTVLATVATHSNRDASDDYRRHSVDLSAYAGRTVTLAFGVTSKAAATDFALDDITLRVG